MKQVVVVDYYDDDIVFLTEAIRRVNADSVIHAFNDSQLALSQLLDGRFGRPDYIFLDVNMPKVLGDEW